ncbi:MAG: HigA family addiction module antitoxin [Hyphomicrobiaceae bacterium]
MRTSRRHPSHPVPHPAEGLREDVLPALKISKAAFAKALGVSRQTLYDLLAERQGITAEMAIRLEKVIGGSAEFWLARQASYDLWKARKSSMKAGLKKLRAATSLREAAE